jgi:hypothetical protein
VQHIREDLSDSVLLWHVITSLDQSKALFLDLDDFLRGYGGMLSVPGTLLAMRASQQPERSPPNPRVSTVTRREMEWWRNPEIKAKAKSMFSTRSGVYGEYLLRHADDCSKPRDVSVIRHFIIGQVCIDNDER